MIKINKYLSIFIISLFSTAAKSEIITMPSSLAAETGFDWNFNNGWNLSSTIDRIDKDGLGHQNYLKFNAFKSF
ncbi:hypothetical protein OAR56_01475 [Pelagibacteraceae bacterium]|nr:hypothetical protein [Pelagibacteraceae bacterium]